MATMVTLEIWDSHKRKADTVDLDEGDRARIYGKAIFTSTSTCLIILQNTHPKSSIIPKSMTQNERSGQCACLDCRRHA